MATKAVVEIAPDAGTDLPTGVRVFQWSGVTEADDCAELLVSPFADVAMEWVGAFGGGTFGVTGSLCPIAASATFWTMRDAGNTALAATAITGNDGRQLLERAYRIKPVRAGGAAVNVTIRAIVTTQARR